MRVSRVRDLVVVLAVAVLIAGTTGCVRGEPGESGENGEPEEPTLTAAPVDVEEETGVRSLIESSGDGYSAVYDAWNCTGIEGVWQLEGELEVEGYGTIAGRGTFTMPPRPAEGPWESDPFSYTMQGTLDMEDATADITYEFQEVVFTVIELEDGPTLGDSRGTAKATVKVTTPEFSMVVSETYVPMSIAPALIRDETHPDCQ